MASPIHVETTVTPEGKIELTLPELIPGQRVRVTVEPAQAPAQPWHVRDIVQNLPGHRLFKMAEEVDAYINEERDSWDR